MSDENEHMLHDEGWEEPRAPDAIARMRAAPACAKCKSVSLALTHASYCDACAAIVRDAALPEPTSLVADVGERRLMITTQGDYAEIVRVQDGEVTRRRVQGGADIDDDVRWLTALPTEPSDAAVEAASNAMASSMAATGITVELTPDVASCLRAWLAAAYAAERGRK